MREPLTILIPAHDSYKEIVELYLNAFKIKWPDCPYDIIWTNGEESISDYHISIINCGKEASFCKRLLYALNSIKTKYVLLTMEDFIITSEVCINDVIDVVNCMEEFHYNFCKLGSSKLYKKSLNNEKYNYIKISQDNLPYGLSINCGIFNREYLVDLIKNESWSGWDLENFCLYLSKHGKLEGCIYDSRDILHITHLIIKGKIIPKSEKRLCKCGISVKLSEQWKRQNYKERLRTFIISRFEIIVPQSKRKVLKMVASKLGIKTVSRY